MGKISFPQRYKNLAEEDPDRTALTTVNGSWTRAELEERADTFARHLRDLGVKLGDMVTMALPNTEAWHISAMALWKLGAIPQPVSPRLPVRELEAIVELADPPVVLGTETTPPTARPFVDVPAWLAANPDPSTETEPLPDAVSPSWKAPTSGGSTGRPKLIVSGDPAIYDDELPVPLLITPNGCMVMPGPLYHNGPLIWSSTALRFGNHVVLLSKFDAEATLQALQDHRADIVYMVPTMMKRILRLPAEQRLSYDLSALRVLWHLAEPCPAWVKDAFIEWLGPEKIVELYGGTEGQLATTITGVEWLQHRGSVGKPMLGQIMICDDDGNEVPNGTIGEVWLKSGRATPTYTYIGAEARTRDGGWESLGDNGWVDDDGYLYLGDRVGDMILSGGANIYPAEVEAALDEHPAIHSCAVIGLPDDDLGSVVHAIVQADAASFDEDDVRGFLADRLVRYKIPRTFELVSEPLRDDAGKVRRSELRAQRVS
ncbi:MAG: bile acid-coenzyme ligase [Actinomycetota bacterium]